MTDDVIRVELEELESTPMTPGENHDDYTHQKHHLRAQLDKIGEEVTNPRVKGICVQARLHRRLQGRQDGQDGGVPKSYVRRLPDAVNNAQHLPRRAIVKGPTGRIAGQRFAMTTATSKVVCREYNETGHIR